MGGINHPRTIIGFTTLPCFGAGSVQGCYVGNRSGSKSPATRNKGMKNQWNAEILIPKRPSGSKLEGMRNGKPAGLLANVPVERLWVLYGNSNQGAVAYGVCASFQEEKGLIIFTQCGWFRWFQAGHSGHSYIHPTFTKDVLLFSSYYVRNHPSVRVTNVRLARKEERVGHDICNHLPFVLEKVSSYLQLPRHQSCANSPSRFKKNHHIWIVDDW